MWVTSYLNSNSVKLNLKFKCGGKGDSKDIHNYLSKDVSKMMLVSKIYKELIKLNTKETA